jgi:hypothetical protein
MVNSLENVLFDMIIEKDSLAAQTIKFLLEGKIGDYRMIEGLCVDPNYPPSLADGFEWIKLFFDQNHVLQGEGTKIYLRYNNGNLEKIDANQVHESLGMGVFQFGYAVNKSGNVLVMGSAGDVIGYDMPGAGFGTKACPPEVAKAVLEGAVLFPEVLDRIRGTYDSENTRTIDLDDAYKEMRASITYLLHPDCGCFYADVDKSLISYGDEILNSDQIRTIAKKSAKLHVKEETPYPGTEIAGIETCIKEDNAEFILEKIAETLGVNVNFIEPEYKPREGKYISNLAKLHPSYSKQK